MSQRKKLVFPMKQKDMLKACGLYTSPKRPESADVKKSRFPMRLQDVLTSTFEDLPMQRPAKIAKMDRNPRKKLFKVPPNVRPSSAGGTLKTAVHKKSVAPKTLGNANNSYQLINVDDVEHDLVTNKKSVFKVRFQCNQKPEKKDKLKCTSTKTEKSVGNPPGAKIREVRQQIETPNSVKRSKRSCDSFIEWERICGVKVKKDFGVEMDTNLTDVHNCSLGDVCRLLQNASLSPGISKNRPEQSISQYLKKLQKDIAENHKLFKEFCVRHEDDMNNIQNMLETVKEVYQSSNIAADNLQQGKENIMPYRRSPRLASIPTSNSSGSLLANDNSEANLYVRSLKKVHFQSNNL